MSIWIKTITFFIACCLPLFGAAQRWTMIDPTTISVTGRRDIIPDTFVTYNLDHNALQAILWQAPEEYLQPLGTSETYLTVGLADGTADIFRIVQYDMMEIELAAAYPNIRTYIGVSLSDPHRTMRADWTVNGFRAVIRDGKGTTYIDPYQRGDLNHRIVYYKQHISAQSVWDCGFNEAQAAPGGGNPSRAVGDCIFRSYRVAVATTGEYSNFFGATSAAQSALVLSQVTTAINRINDVYEVDIAVRLLLVGNTNAIFYYAPASDPYSGDACTQLNQNQTTCDNVIGSANYDIGHVFSVGSGGCAGLGVICSGGNKARGATGLNPPTGDPFYIDYVAHELGHQFGGNHTQNNNCNRNSATAMEPGSASTIMGYAGICAPNVQNNSDAYFHAISLQEIANEIASTSCAVTISNANSAPVVSNVPNYTIPISTPFVLTASATDGNNNPLTYCWEQWDQEVGAMPPASTNTVGPMFRSLLPSASPSRYFYNLTDLVNNVNPMWEELPSVARTMEFRVTVRDLYDGTFGCTDEDNTIITTAAGSGPFTVTSQNTGATWQETSSQTITWNVANTTASPVSCVNVEIKLSYDGGFTYPTILAASEPNDGSANVTIPPGTSTMARVMVKAINNIFFDINNANITIEPGTPNFTLALNPASVTECNDGSVTTTVLVGSFMGFSNPVTLSMLNVPPGGIATFLPTVVIPGGTSTLTISNLGSLFGTYTPTVRGSSTTGIKDVGFPITLLSTPTTAPNLISPINNNPADVAPLLDWSAIAGYSNYEYQIASNSNFSSIILSGTATTDLFQVLSGLAQNTQYWWRVRVANGICLGPWSSSSSFTTTNCFSFASTNVPITIPSQGSPTVTSTLTIPTSLNISDINVINLVGTHSWVNDLEFTLISPGGTQVLFWDQPCGNHDNFNINFNDEAPVGIWPCPPNTGGTFRPSNAMTPFDGGLSNGTWTLSIHDVANQDGGALTGWGLQVCGSSSCSLTVNQTSGSGSGSLPAAINCAVTGDTIYLSSALAGQTINIGASELVISKNLVVIAQGVNTKITGTGSKVFEIAPGISFELNGVGVTAGTGLLGSAINSKGNLTLKNASVFKNAGVSGAVLVQNLSGEMKLIGNCFINN